MWAFLLEVNGKGSWANKNRPDYEADVWYNKDLNRIALEMIGDRAVGKKVLALGAAMWVDAELLASLGAASYLRTDIIKTEGIDLVCDACELPFADESFDMVVCREVIEHVLDEARMLSEIRRVLVPNGWLFITTPNMLNVWPDGFYHVRGYVPRAFINQMERAGFKVIDKRGNVPNIHTSLMFLSKKGMGSQLLPEFQYISGLLESCEESYYLGTQLIVLAQKGVYEDKSAVKN